MPYKVVKRNPRRKMMKRKQVVRRSPSSVSPVVKSYVKRMINIKTEDKICQNVSQTPTTMVPMSSTLLNPINLSSVWVLSQGVNQGNRVGNVLSPKSWRVKGYFAVPLAQGTNPSTLPMFIKMYIYKLKNGFGVPTAATNFYQNGNTNVAPSGTFSDHLKNVNLDFFTLYTTRSFKCGSATQLGIVQGAGNNDFKNICAFNINLLKYQKASLKYSDVTTSPTNSGLYMSYTVCLSDGTVVAANTLPNLAFEIEATFEDA